MDISPITFHQAKTAGIFALSVFWENDPFIASDDEPSDSNHGITLNEAKFNYLRFGACEEGMLRYVRPPQNDEKSALR
ncbi:MAG: CPCC family cysteine-rich protein [Subdoligranulum sp.]